MEVAYRAHGEVLYIAAPESTQIPGSIPPILESE
jgi:hypothetical protein